MNISPFLGLIARAITRVTALSFMGWLALLTTAPVSATTMTATDLEYERDVAPILKTYCVGCHNDTDKEGDLSLMSLDALRAGGADGSVVIESKPEASRLFQVISGAAEPKMPPNDEPQLKVEQVALLREWIAQGARGDSKANGSMAKLNSPKLPKDKNSARQVTAVCGVGDGGLVVSRFGLVELRSAQGEVVWVFDQLPGKVNQIRRTPDGKTLVVATGIAGVAGEVVLLDIETGALQLRLQGHADAAYCASASADGKWIASGSYDKSVILWSRATGTVARKLAGHNGAIYDLDFDATSSVVATGSADQTVKLWSVSGGRLDTLGQPQGEVLSVRFSPDGRYLFAAGVDRQIRKWKLESREEPAINPMLVARFAHEDDVLQIEFVGVDRMVSTSVDRTVKLWDTEQIRPLGQVALVADQPVGIVAATGGLIQVLTVKGDATEIAADVLEKLVKQAEQKRASVERAEQVANRSLNMPNAETKVVSVTEAEPNDELASAAKVDLPVQITGLIESRGEGGSDTDLYRFSAKAGEHWILGVNAARGGSPLDSRIEILDEYGKSLVQTRLQAMRESYFTFRGKDSNTSDDFRVHNWEDMELNEYLYAGGEIVKLWLYPRGPDSGFKVYPGTGSRYTYFGTTPTSHALGAPAYIVRELVDEEEALPNGLPIFPIYYENDDDSLRRWGKDSRLSFEAPRTGDYFVKIRDARGFSGADFKYTLEIVQPQPDFTLKVDGTKLKMPVGSGREWQVTATRLDELEEEILVEVRGLPEGFIATNPLVIEAGQMVALGTIYATNDAQKLLATSGDDANASKKFELSLFAKSLHAGKWIEHELKEKIELELMNAPELRVRLTEVRDADRELEELTIRPGQTISARVVIDRSDIKGPVSFGGDDSGRNLPHGTIVDNIGLNGLLLPDGVNDREFFITASKWLSPQRRQIHLRSQSKDNPTSKPIWLNVVPNQ